MSGAGLQLNAQRGVESCWMYEATEAAVRVTHVEKPRRARGSRTRQTITTVICFVLAFGKGVKFLRCHSHGATCRHTQTLRC